MTDLSSAVCSITATQRRRYFWAAWWTGAPQYAPFRKPDASNGGARTFEEALAEAEAVAQRHLIAIDGHWATAWKSVLRGQTPVPPPARATRAVKPPPNVSTHNVSSWSVLGLQPGATLTEVKLAFRKRALETHPDQGGDAAQFRAAHQAYEKLVAKLSTRASKSK
jgi:hypothetical protein